MNNFAWHKPDMGQWVRDVIANERGSISIFRDRDKRPVDDLRDEVGSSIFEEPEDDESEEYGETNEDRAVRECTAAIQDLRAKTIARAAAARADAIRRTYYEDSEASELASRANRQAKCTHGARLDRVGYCGACGLSRFTWSDVVMTINGVKLDMVDVLGLM